MATRTTEKPVLTTKFFTQETVTYGVDIRSSVRAPISIFKISSEFTGPYNKNWLYISALAYATMKQSEKRLLPYQLDAVTVVEMEYDINGNCVWEVSENLYDYRAWNMAPQLIVSMSGAQYGGVAKLLDLEGKSFIHSEYKYADFIFSESVHLIPMVPARAITMSMDPRKIEVEFEIEPYQIFSKRRDGSDDAEYNYIGAFANACIPNDVKASELTIIKVDKR